LSNAPPSEGDVEAECPATSEVAGTKGDVEQAGVPTASETNLRTEGDVGNIYLISSDTTLPRIPPVEGDPGDDCFRPQCAICLAEFKPGDAVSWSHDSQCQHQFHRVCIVEWLIKHRECPCCRRRYLANDGDHALAVEQPAQPPHSASSSSNAGVSR
jgi:hypothetical protein